MGNINAGAVAAIDDQAIIDSPNAAAAAAIEGDSILAAANLDIDDDDYQQPPPEPLPPLFPPAQNNAYAIHESHIGSHCRVEAGDEDGVQSTQQ